jgi:hypothetical protein
MTCNHEPNEREQIAPDDPEQFQRFVEAARELGADTPEAIEKTDRALRRMLPPREPGKPVERREVEPKPKRTYTRKKSTP